MDPFRYSGYTYYLSFDEKKGYLTLAIKNNLGDPVDISNAPAYDWVSRNVCNSAGECIRQRTSEEYVAYAHQQARELIDWEIDRVKFVSEVQEIINNSS